MFLVRRALLVLLAALLTLPFLAVSALAHENRTVGDLKFTVGFTPEPAVAGQPIAIEVLLAHDGKPAVLTDKELAGMTAHLFAGKVAGKTPVAGDYKNLPNQPMPLHATPWIGPGHYETESIIPTVPGDYTVHLTTKDGKTILDGQEVNLLFVTGDNTYGPVANPTKLQFPVKVPTNAELATLFNRSATRQAAAQTAADAKANDMADDVSRLQTMNLVFAIALAILLVAVLLVAVSARGRSRSRHSDRPVADAG